jgi:opacity protein-like surface antigen
MTTVERALLFAILAGVTLGTTTTLAAQLPQQLSAEVRVGAGIPTGDFADGLSAGLGIGGILAYRVIPELDVFAGYSSQSFGVDDDPEFEGVDLDVNDSGFAIGGRFFVPGLPSVAPWLQAAVLLHELEVTGREQGVSVSLSSDREVGFEIGGGLEIPVAANIGVTPGIRYRQYSVDFDLEDDGPVSGDVTYLTLDVGVRFRF